MNEFSELLREAFRADETFDPDPGREALLAAIDGYERRMSLVRRMAWVGVTFFTAMTVWMVVLLWQEPNAPPTNRELFVAAMLIFSAQGIAFGKAWFYDMNNHIRLMKELKRTQLMTLERKQG